MPENENQDVQADVPVGETKMQKFEREQLSRRAALRKMGYTSALAAFALFGVDDVVRLVGRKMERRAADDRVAEQVAKELQCVGVTLASPISSGNPCQDCWTNFVCAIHLCGCLSPNGVATPQCKNNANYSFKHCTNSHCGQSGPVEGGPMVGCLPCPVVIWA